MHIWQLGFACISRGRGRGRIELDSYLLGFVYENIIRSSHSTDHVKGNRMSKKKQGHHSPNRVRTQKKRREVRCTERAVQQNSFWWQNLHDSLTHSQIGRQSRCCHEKFVGIRCIRCWHSMHSFTKRSRTLRCYVDLMDRLIDKAEDVASLRNRSIIRSLGHRRRSLPVLRNGGIRPLKS